MEVRTEIFENVFKILKHAGYDNVGMYAVKKFVSTGLEAKEDIIELVKDKINENWRIEKEIDIVNSVEEQTIINTLNEKIDKLYEKLENYYIENYPSLNTSFENYGGCKHLIKLFMQFMLKNNLLYLSSDFTFASDVKIYYYNKENKYVSRTLQTGTKSGKLFSFSQYFGIAQIISEIYIAYLLKQNEAQEILNMLNDRKTQDLMSAAWSQVIDFYRLKTHKVKLVLSFNPIDYLICSYHFWDSDIEYSADTGSCFRIHRKHEHAYSGAPFFMWLTPNMLIATIEEIESSATIYCGEKTDIFYPRKFFRAWVGVDSSLEGFFVGRHYPTYHNVYGRLIANYIKEIFEEKLGKLKIYKEYDYDYENCSGNVYLDDPTFFIVKEGCEKVKVIIDDEKGICLYCSDEFESGSHNRYEHLCSYCKSNYYTCQHCGDEISEDNAYWVDDEVYCEHCYNELFTRCYICDSIIRIEDAYEVEGEDVCYRCYEQYAYECYYCWNAFFRSNIVYINNNYYCTDCAEDLFVKCEHCDEYIEKEKATKINENYYCESCVSELFYYCEYCDKYVELVYETNEGKFACEECYKEIRRSVVNE